MNTHEHARMAPMLCYALLHSQPLRSHTSRHTASLTRTLLSTRFPTRPSTTDCRPFKDPNFETKRREHNASVQATAEISEAASQTTWFRPMNKILQYAPIEMEKRRMHDQLDSAEMRTFLGIIRERYEEALQQNETVDIFSDDFAGLTEEVGARMRVSLCLGRHIHVSTSHPLLSPSSHRT